MDEFEIVCNWKSDEEKELDRVIVCSPERKFVKGIESVTAETCVCLIQDIANDILPQKPELEIKSKLPLKKLNIYSEASLIEVFGLYNEYLCTSKADFIDDWEGLAVYHASIELPGITICKLKFTRMREKNRLWLYNIQPTTVQSDLSNHRLSNFQTLFNLISSSSQKCETAEVKKIIEAQLKTSSTNPPFSLQSLINVINKECSFQFQDCKKNLCKCLNNSGYLLPCGNSSKDDVSKNKLDYEQIMNYIDKKFIELKGELMNQMEINLAQLRNEYNERLDEIMKEIENAKI